MTKVSAPPARDYGQETRDTLQAQVDLAPSLYAAESSYRPKYTELDLQTLGTSLRGTPSTSGLLDLYETDVAPVLTRLANTDREARVGGELDVLNRYAGDVTRTLREASGNAPLVEELNRQALEDLSSGASLDPSLAAEVSQAARAGAADRGFGFGAPDAVTEAFARGERGVALRNQRRQFAGQVVGLNQATGGDPVMTILGRPSQTVGMVPGVVGQGAGVSSNGVFNPESGYAQDVFDTNYNGQAAARIATANNSNALFGAGLGALGSLGGSALGQARKSP